MNSSVQVINFDVFTYAEKIALNPIEIEEYFKKGGVLA